MMPAGLEVTVPLPVPSPITVRLGRFTTVSVVLPLRSAEVAVIVVDPGPRAVANPEASIVATVVLLLVHVTPPSPSTVTGVNAQEGLFGQGRVPLELIPTPTRPSSFRPQQRTVPSCRSTQECSAPDEPAAAVVIPVADGAGVVEIDPSEAPLPVGPPAVSPRPRTGPSRKTAHRCSAPGATC